MFKKLFAFSLMICLFTVQANAVAENGLKAAFDELNYALTVVWDQKDQSFYDKEVQKFNSKVVALQAQGMSNQELMNFALENVKDAKIQKDLQTAFTMITINRMSPSEARNYVSETLKKSYSRGASWGGEVLVGVVVFVIIIAVAAIIAGKARVNEDEGCYEVWTCDDYCTGSVCYEDCGYRCVN